MKGTLSVSKTPWTVGRIDGRDYLRDSDGDAVSVEKCAAFIAAAVNEFAMREKRAKLGPQNPPKGGQKDWA